MYPGYKNFRHRLAGDGTWRSVLNGLTADPGGSAVDNRSGYNNGLELKRKLIWIVVGVIVIGGAAYPFLRSKSSQAPQYQFAAVTRGSLRTSVSSTGSLQAVGTVNVGTQVSGTVSAIYADFNDRVKAGQRLAVLDSSLLASSVRDAEANLARAEAQNRQAVAEYNRGKPLLEKGYLSQTEFLPVETNVTVTQSAVVSARSTLERARTNLAYATIESPMDGTIIERNIDAGQTVAASFNTPTLFVIAKDLSQMQIFATVDETDIGEVRLGQKVTFTVQTWPDEVFSGVVSQIRLKPITIQNVVNYTVIIDASNPNNLLMPGMTATIDFILNEVQDVLRAPNNALRFLPDAEQLKLLGLDPDARRLKPRAGGEVDSTRHHGGDGNGPKDGKRGKLWSVDSKGKLVVIRVQTGNSDGKLTEVSGDSLSEGMQVITGITPAGTAEKKGSLFPGMRPPRGMH